MKNAYVFQSTLLAVSFALLAQFAHAAKLDTSACTLLLEKNLQLAQGLVPSGPLKAYRYFRNALILNPRAKQTEITYPAFKPRLDWMEKALLDRLFVLRDKKMAREIEMLETVLERVRVLKSSPQLCTLKAVSQITGQFSLVISLGLPSREFKGLLLDYEEIGYDIRYVSGYDKPKPLNQQKGFIANVKKPAFFVGYPTVAYVSINQMNRLSPIFAFYIGLAKNYVGFDFNERFKEKHLPYILPYHDDGHMSEVLSEMSRPEYGVDNSEMYGIDVENDANLYQVLAIENARLQMVKALYAEIEQAQTLERKLAYQTVFFFLTHEFSSIDLTYMYTAKDFAKLNSKDFMGDETLSDVASNIQEIVLMNSFDPFFKKLIAASGDRLHSVLLDGLIWIQQFGEKNPGLGVPSF